MDAPQTSVAVELDDAGALLTDVPCTHCGYNIRGLRPDGKCPECATPVDDSLRGDLLRYANPLWLTRLADGIVLIFVGVVLSAIIGTGCSVGMIIVSTGGGGGMSLANVGGLFGLIFMLVGAWMLTAPDPSGKGEQRYATARKTVRVSLLIGVAASLLTVLLEAAAASAAAELAVAVINVVAQINQLVGTFAMLLYLERLSLRIPNEVYARHARVIRWGFAIGLSLAVLIGIAAAMFAAQTMTGPPGAAGAVPGPSRGLVLFGCVGGISVIAMLVLSIAYLVLLHRLRKAFREQAALALSDDDESTSIPPPAPPSPH